jgi:hypothetical protein
VFNLDTCDFVVWGYKNVYHTHTHIHEAFVRTLQLMGKRVRWLDQADKHVGTFSNTLVITNHDCITNSYWPWETPIRSALPRRDDCFYLIHGMNDVASICDEFSKYPSLSWNVFHDFSHTLGMPSGDYPRPPVGVPLTDCVYLDTDVPFYPNQKHMNFRWATDLIPSEIEANKPNMILGRHSRFINWVGTVWWVNEKELSEFRNACEKDGKEFRHLGGGQQGVISVQENIRLVRTSFMAPAISGSHHLTEGYAPCRIFKNISYGQFGITNSKRVNDIFEGKLIFNPDPHDLYFEAKERLATMKVEELHALMDYVAKKHTYINRINAVFQAIRMLT